LKESLIKITRILVGSFLLLVLLSFTFPIQAGQAQGPHFHTTQPPATTAKGGPRMQVNAGFETRYRDGNWVPVQVALHNDGPDFSGTLSINASTDNGLYSGSRNVSTPSHYQVPITLANGAQKQITIYVPIYFDVQSVVVRLLDSSGNIVSSQDGVLNPLNFGDTLVGVLSDQSAGFGPLNAVSLPNQGNSVIVEFLNASTMPAIAAVLKNFDIIILDNFTTSSLSAAQLTALQIWVNQGGALIMVGGPEWHRTLATLPAGLLPVAVNGTTTLAAGAHLLPLGGPNAGRLGQSGVADTVQASVTASSAILQGDPGKSEIVLASGTTPLITQTNVGQGTVCYLAFDPTLEPIVGWPGASALWKGLLFRSLGDQLLSNPNSYPGPGYYGGPGQSLLASRMSGLLQSLLPNTIPSPWTLAILLVGYILVLGPIRLLVLRRLKRRDWSWRIVLSSIVIFSGLAYGLAIEEKGTSIVSNSVSVVQLSQDGSPAHITTYLGVFAPNQGDFQVYIPGNGLVQPSPDTYYSYYAIGRSNSGNQSPTIVTPIKNGTSVNLQGVEFGTLHSILSDQDRPVQEGLISHLAINNGTLVGTVTNTLNYALSDAYVLMPYNVLSLGRLAAGQTKQVTLPLNNSTSTPGETLADLIVQNSGSAYPYGVYPFNSGPQRLTEQQRHLTILMALDGQEYFGNPGIGPIKPILPILPVPINSALGTSNIFVTGGGITISSLVSSSGSLPSVSFSGVGPYLPMTGDNDPLLVPGSAATLIGWAEKPFMNGVTINGISPTGLHETLVQAPLTVNLSGILNLPPYFISGHLIDVEGNNVQAQFPGIYAMTTGSMTFEFAIPSQPDLQVSGLTITEPPNAYQPGLGAVAANGSPLPLRLYNWHTGAWDAVSLQQSAFTTTNVAAYIGPGGRVLLQLANQDSSLGTLIFSTPSLNLQGVALGP
jgi:hypothetical protein